MTGAQPGRGPGSGARTTSRARGRASRRRFTEQARRSAIAPVTGAMLSRAHERAAQILDQAHREAADTVARARRDADARVEQARMEGRAQSAPLAASLLGRGRRDARSVLLGAQREAHEQLHAQVRAAVATLRDEPGYGLLLERLAGLARQAAGPGATVTEDPDGGVVARGKGVIVDCSLPRLADAAVMALGDDVAWLWTPGQRRPAGDHR